MCECGSGCSCVLKYLNLYVSLCVNNANINILNYIYFTICLLRIQTKTYLQNLFWIFNEMQRRPFNFSFLFAQITNCSKMHLMQKSLNSYISHQISKSHNDSYKSLFVGTSNNLNLICNRKWERKRSPITYLTKLSKHELIIIRDFSISFKVFLFHVLAFSPKT